MLKILPAKNNFNRLFLITLSTKTDKAQKTKQNKKTQATQLTEIGLFPAFSFSFPTFAESHFSALMSASFHSGQMGNLEAPTW